MKLIGRWRRGHEDYELFAPPQELVGSWPPEQKSVIVNYIHFDRVKVKNRLSYEFLSTQSCEFRCGKKWTSKSMHVRDSEWVWPFHLSHYVQHHDVMLPIEFIQHALRSTDKPWLFNHQDKSQIDDTYWKGWCRENRSHSERQAIKSSLEAEEVRRQERLIRRQEEYIERAKELERLTGISDTTCMYSGCSSMALIDREFCAKCLVEKHNF